MFKKIIKWVSITIGLVFVLLVCLLIYVNMASEEQELEAEHGPLAYTELLALAKTSQLNPNVYAASQITPDNPLFEGVLALQRQKLKLADDKLTVLAEAGNSEAMFWLATTKLGTNMFFNRQAAELYVKAATLGNPYAALKLDPASIDCQRYLGSACSKTWRAKGIELLRERAKSGDAMAVYHSKRRYKKKGTEADYRININLVTEAAKAGYYAPLYEAVLRFERDKQLSPEKKHAIVDLLTLAANNNFVPAVGKLISLSSLRVSLGYVGFISDELAHTYRYQLAKLAKKSSMGNIVTSLVYKKNTIKKSDLLEAYKFSLVEKTLFPDSRTGRNLIALAIENGSATELPDAEKQQIQVAADKFISQMTPVIYVDEMHLVDDY